MLTTAQQQIKDSLGEQFESIKGLSKHRYIHSLLNGDKVNSTYYVNIAKKHGLELEHIKQLYKAVDVYDRHFLIPELISSEGV